MLSAIQLLLHSTSNTLICLMNMGCCLCQIQTEVGATKTDQYLIFSVINDLKNIDIYHRTDQYLLK